VLDVVAFKVVYTGRASLHGLGLSRHQTGRVVAHARAKLTPLGRALIVERVMVMGWAPCWIEAQLHGAIHTRFPGLR
jgi:hypothetical protein